jgi:hypothetical protein
MEMTGVVVVIAFPNPPLSGRLSICFPEMLKHISVRVLQRIAGFYITIVIKVFAEYVKHFAFFRSNIRIVYPETKIGF